jgi:hypothetical protein
MGLPALELQRLGSSHQLGFHAQSSLMRFLFRFAGRFVGLERAQQPRRHKRHCAVAVRHVAPHQLHDVHLPTAALQKQARGLRRFADMKKQRFGSWRSRCT